MKDRKEKYSYDKYKLSADVKGRRRYPACLS